MRTHMKNRSKSKGFENIKLQLRHNGFIQEIISQSSNGASCSKKPSGFQQLLTKSLTFDSILSNPNEFEERYTIGEAIGQGASAVVKKCFRKHDGAIFAVKISEVEEEHLAYLQKLFKILRTLSHPCILSYHDMFLNMNRRTCQLVMDYIKHSPLSEFIANLSEEEIRTITEQLLRTVLFLHKHRICHRDIKPTNILYDRAHSKIWLIDFGVSKLTHQKNMRRNMLTHTGTTGYKAPELFQGGMYTESVDLWAVGVVLYEMVEKKLPFSDEYLKDTIQHIINIQYVEGKSWERISKHAKDLLHRLLRPSSSRLTAKEALHAPWFMEAQRVSCLDQTARAQDKSTSCSRSNSGKEEIQRLSGPQKALIASPVKRVKKPKQHKIMTPQPTVTGTEEAPKSLFYKLQLQFGRESNWKD